MTEELIRNLTNLNLGIGGQQSQALLQAPLQQAQLGGQLQGQGQNQLQNIFNAFSVPVTQGFNAGNQLFGQTQFGSQFAPAQFAGPALQNAQSLVSGGQFAQGSPSFLPIPVQQQPTFGRTFGQNFAGTLGSTTGALPARGITAGAGAFGGGIDNSFGSNFMQLGTPQA
jgi:hypothetical protein